MNANKNKHISTSPTAVRLVGALLLPILLVILSSSPVRLSAKDPTKTKAQPVPSEAAETARRFLGHLEKGDVNAAIGLWDTRQGDGKLKARLDKMVAKVSKVGGIRKVDAGPCEERRTKKFEEVTGEKIEVVPVEIICGDENLILAVFSIRKKEGASRIFQLESLKEWGGTASLDDELKYNE